MIARIVLAGCAALMLQGCLAKAAVDVVTLPVRAASKAVDLATTSQSEADEKRGRALRKREEEYGRLERSWQKNRERCEAGSRAHCDAAARDMAQMEQLRRTIPVEPD